MMEYLSQPVSIASALLGIAVWYFYNRGVAAKIKSLQFQIDQLRKDTKGEVHD